MSAIITDAIVKHSQGTAAAWTSANPVLESGEEGYETDTGFWKWGDGATVWNSLDYQPSPAEVDGKASLSTYSTAWINRSLWQNKHLGTDDTKNADSNLNHALSAPLAELVVKVFISTDGTDANSFEAQGVVASTVSTGGVGYGFTPYAVDNDNIIIQTGSSGVVALNTNGTLLPIDTEDWYYKIVVYKLS